MQQHAWKRNHAKQRRRNDNINKKCVLEGVGEGENLKENCPKTLFFLANAMTINLEILRILLSEILLSLGRLLAKEKNLQGLKSWARLYEFADVLESPKPANKIKKVESSSGGLGVNRSKKKEKQVLLDLFLTFLPLKTPLRPACDLLLTDFIYFGVSDPSASPQ